MGSPRFEVTKLKNVNMLLCISLIKQSRDYMGFIRESKLVIKKGEESHATSREIIKGLFSSRL